MLSKDRWKGRDSIIESMKAPNRFSTRVIVVVVAMLALFEVSRNVGQMRRVSIYLDEKPLSWMTEGRPSAQQQQQYHKTTVAYAVSVTDFDPDDKGPYEHIDRAAVLHQSIKLAMQKSPRYDYHIYAFVHPDAILAKPLLERLGYRVQIRDTPFNITDIPNPELIDSQRIGCCGVKEYIKLYSYLLSDYPVVVHLDLDTIVLRPMDDVFDFMVLTHNNTSRLSADQVESFAKTSAMWMNRTFDVSRTHAYKTVLETPERINFMFTKDYNMVRPVIPPWKVPYQMGVQGGFLVLRPNQRDFDRMLEIILAGGNYTGSEWGGRDLGYGGYYGAGTIQGLASYYYDYHENATRSIELNRCNYNTMVEHSHEYNEDEKKALCRTTEEECENCRETKLQDVYTAHFTVCPKPEDCAPIDPKEDRLCAQLTREWHKVRFSLELEWMKRFSSPITSNGGWLSLPYIPTLKGVDPTESREKFLESDKMGHCNRYRYIPLVLPAKTRSMNNQIMDTLI